MENHQNTLGCLIMVGILCVVGFVTTQLKNCSGSEEETQSGFAGPVPVRFQGAYNSYLCGQGTDGLVTVGGDDINYGGAIFKVESKVSETQGSVTLQGRPFSAGGTEAERTITISYAPVGGTARIDGSEFDRCSQY